MNNGRKTKCDLCGSPVILHSSDEGTSYYEPVNNNEIEALRQQLAESEERVRDLESILIEPHTKQNIEHAKKSNMDRIIMSIRVSDLDKALKGDSDE